MPEGLQINIYVQPGAKVSQIDGEHDGRLKVRIAAPPVDGAANEEVIRFFAKILGMKQKDVQVLRGEKSRKKDLLCVANEQQILGIVETLRKI